MFERTRPLQFRIEPLLEALPSAGSAIAATTAMNRNANR